MLKGSFCSGPDLHVQGSWPNAFYSAAQYRRQEDRRQEDMVAISQIQYWLLLSAEEQNNAASAAHQSGGAKLWKTDEIILYYWHNLIDGELDKAHLKLLAGALREPKICPCCELLPTAMTTRRPWPSRTRLPDLRNASEEASFMTSSDSPVNALSSTLQTAMHVPKATRQPWSLWIHFAGRDGLLCAQSSGILS